ncbi:MAG: hypothetical protein PHI13_13765 [Methylococcales bacterium]|nr:hypothetical protein [Methylococcales bacterium]
MIKNQSRVSNQFAYFLRHAVSTFGFDEADGESAQLGDVLGTMAGTDTAAVFVVVPIDHIVAAVFNAPLLAVRLEDFCGIGLFRLATGHSVNDFVSVFTGFLFNAFPFNHEGLADVGEIQVTVKRCGFPDFADFDATVIGWGDAGEVHILAQPEHPF